MPIKYRFDSLYVRIMVAAYPKEKGNTTSVNPLLKKIAFNMQNISKAKSFHESLVEIFPIFTASESNPNGKSFSLLTTSWLTGLNTKPLGKKIP